MGRGRGAAVTRIRTRRLTDDAAADFPAMFSLASPSAPWPPARVAFAWSRDVLGLDGTLIGPEAAARAMHRAMAVLPAAVVEHSGRSSLFARRVQLMRMFNDLAAPLQAAAFTDPVALAQLRPLQEVASVMLSVLSPLDRVRVNLRNSQMLGAAARPGPGPDPGRRSEVLSMADQQQIWRVVRVTLDALVWATTDGRK